VNPFRRAAREHPARLDDDTTRLAWQAISLLLDYPDERWVQSQRVVRGLLGRLPDAVGMPLRAFLADVASLPLGDVQRTYVETFDVTRRCCLYLTYFHYGDTRRRGVALVQFKQAYRRAGVEFDAEELPDHLCVVLEFGATADLRAGRKLLTDYRAGIEMLRIALQDKDSSWAQLTVALCATLPELNGEGMAAVQRLIEQGPPQEDVGLQAYALDPRLNPSPASEIEPVDLGRHIPVGVRS